MSRPKSVSNARHVAIIGAGSRGEHTDPDTQLAPPPMRGAA
jgi:hypothetical protein